MAAWEKLIHEKNQQSKISWHCPFKRGSFTITGKSTIKAKAHFSGFRLKKIVLLQTTELRRTPTFSFDQVVLPWWVHVMF